MTETDEGRPPTELGSPLRLPCGVELANRLAKSAMSEALGTVDNRPTAALVTLYRRWAAGGLGLCVTGNVMVDRRALGEPNNVAIEDERDLELLGRWAEAGSQGGTSLWVQLNHPGKQAPRGLNRETVAPSAVAFGRAMGRAFATPRELAGDEIEDLVRRFGQAAAVAKRAGFGGVQIHGAHGYLVSQFLSPRHNLRADRWGGDLEGRMRFVIEVYREIRERVGAAFPVGIKLNSADFQRGGFAEDESLLVVEALAGLGIDLVEISGGNYEAPAMSGARRGEVKESTRAREAYFLEFAERARARVSVPLMVTGGFRSRRAMVEALASGALDLVGMARPLVLDPDLPRRLLAGEDLTSPVRRITTGVAAIDRMALMEVLWYSRQLRLLGQGKPPRPDEPPLLSLAALALSGGLRTLRTRRLRASS